MAFDNFRDLWFDAMVLDGDIAWVFANNFNALFTIALETGETKYIVSVPEEQMLSQGLYFNMQKHGDELILIPAYADNLAFYNIKTGKFRYLNIDVPKPKFWGAAIEKDCLCLVGNGSASIVSIEMDSLEYTIYDDCIKHFANEKCFDNPMPFRKNDCVVDGKMYIASCITNEIVTFCFSTKEIDIIQLGCDFKGFRNIKYDGKCYWISAWKEGKLLRANANFERLDEIKFSSKLFKCSDIIALDEIWIFPLNEPDVYIINRNLSSIRKFDIGNMIQNVNLHPWDMYYTAVAAKEKYIYVFLGDGFCLLRIDLDDEKIEGKSMKIEESDISTINLLRNRTIIYENEINLDRFIRMI